MNAELLRESGNLINAFGFPIFFGIIMLGFLYLLFRYFTKALDKKDCDFLDYIQKRDSEFSVMAKQHNESFEKNTNAIRENTLATHKMIGLVTGQTRVTKRSNLPK